MTATLYLQIYLGLLGAALLTWNLRILILGAPDRLMVWLSSAGSPMVVRHAAGGGVLIALGMLLMAAGGMTPTWYFVGLATAFVGVLVVGRGERADPSGREERRTSRAAMKSMGVFLVVLVVVSGLGILGIHLTRG